MSNNIEYILCSAIWFDNGNQYHHQPNNINSGYVICGRRHHNCFTTAYILDPDREYLQYEKEQGFLTNKNRFVDREEGLRIAIDSGQINKETINQNKDELFSEDLW